MKSSDIEGVVLKSNKVAMDFLQHENYREALALLKQAEEMLNNPSAEVPDRFKLLGITLNNLGCYYKRKKQFKVALDYLKSALRVELQLDKDTISIASTHLNISAIYSAASKHNEAFKHARMALKLLEEAPPEEPSKNHTTSVVISYYNAGVELEHLGRLPESLNYLKSGLSLAETALGRAHPLTVNLAQANQSLARRTNEVLGMVHTRQLQRRNNRVSPHRVRRGVIESVKGGLRQSLPPRRENNKRITENLEKIKLIASKLN